MDLLAAINWNPNPVALKLGPMTIVWYGVLFASAFIVGTAMLNWVFKTENKPKEDVDSIFVYMFFGTLIGARLGHCFFYEPGTYLKDPIKIFMVWKGGLASHGGAIGILTAMWIYVKRNITFMRTTSIGFASHLFGNVTYLSYISFQVQTLNRS